MLTHLAVTLAHAAPDSTTVAAASEFARHAEGWPITIGFFSLITLLGAFFYWLLFRAWPEWRLEQAATRAQRELESEKTRSHIAGMMRDRGQEAKEDVAAEREASKERHGYIVEQVSGQINRLHEKVDDVSRKTGAIAAKLGLPVVIILGLMGLLAPICAHVVRSHGSFANSLVKHAAFTSGIVGAVAETSASKEHIRCVNPSCSKGFYCCGEEKCCEEKKDTAHKPRPSNKAHASTVPVSPLPDGGHSLRSFASLACFADSLCDRVRGCL